MHTPTRTIEEDVERLNSLLEKFLEWDDRADRAEQCGNVKDALSYRQSATACAAEAFRLAGLLPETIPQYGQTETATKQVTTSARSG